MPIGFEILPLIEALAVLAPFVGLFAVIGD